MSGENGTVVYEIGYEQRRRAQVRAKVTAKQVATYLYKWNRNTGECLSKDEWVRNRPRLLSYQIDGEPLVMLEDDGK